MRRSDSAAFHDEVQTAVVKTSATVAKYWMEHKWCEVDSSQDSKIAMFPKETQFPVLVISWPSTANTFKTQFKASGWTEQMKRSLDQLRTVSQPFGIGAFFPNKTKHLFVF